MGTAIIGAGIIGLATAFYLSESVDPSSIHLIETTPTLFSSASGYAGGFLAEDWFSASSAELGILSFAEHKRLAEKYNGTEKWGYSRSTGTTYTPSRVSETGKTGERTRAQDVWCREGGSRAEVAPQQASDGISNYVEDDEPNHPKWLSRTHGDKVDIISEEGTTAQVLDFYSSMCLNSDLDGRCSAHLYLQLCKHKYELNSSTFDAVRVDPRRLCQFLLYKCQSRGVHIHYPARPVSLGSDDDDVISSIRIQNVKIHQYLDIPCTRILISAGAWSPQVYKTLFPSSKLKIPVSSLAGHSLVVNSPRWQKHHEESGCHAIFTTDEQGYSPEIFSRTGGEIYVAGMNSETIPLPKTAQDAEIDDEVLMTLRTTAKRLLGLPKMDDLVEVRKGLCFRPVTKRGTPFLSRLQDSKLGGVRSRGSSEGGVFIAAGHGPWGISLGLGTGKVMSEMMKGEKLSADVSGLKL